MSGSRFRGLWERIRERVSHPGPDPSQPPPALSHPEPQISYWEPQPEPELSNDWEISQEREDPDRETRGEILAEIHNTARWLQYGFAVYPPDWEFLEGHGVSRREAIQQAIERYGVKWVSGDLHLAAAMAEQEKEMER